MQTPFEEPVIKIESGHYCIRYFGTPGTTPDACFTKAAFSRIVKAVVTEHE